MEGSSWRPDQGESSSMPDASSDDRRSQFPPEDNLYQSFQHPGGPGQVNPSINQNAVDPATVDSIAPTRHVAVADLQEEIYQQIKSMKEIYYADLNEFHQRICMKLQQNDALPSAKAAEQFEIMKNFKMMLERTLQVLQLSKANISPSLKDKLPMYEKQIQNILASNKKKAIPSQAPGQQQFQNSSSHSQLVQQQQQTQVSQLQQHGSPTGQLEWLRH